jgi:hypothetical protein
MLKQSSERAVGKGDTWVNFTEQWSLHGNKEGIKERIHTRLVKQSIL